MFPFCNLFGKWFFVFSQSSQNIIASIFIFEGGYSKYDKKKIYAHSKPHNCQISRNKMDEKSGFEIIVKSCEHVT